MICSWFLPQFLFWTVQTVFVGDDGTLFSVHLEHNGFFCGLGENLSYVNASIANYDYCSVQTWSLQCLEDMLRHLGYEPDGKMHVYWCKPGSAISDGLVCIESQADIQAMCTVVREQKTLVLLVDHVNFLRNPLDDVILNGGPPLPPVISSKGVSRD